MNTMYTSIDEHPVYIVLMNTMYTSIDEWWTPCILVLMNTLYTSIDEHPVY